MHYYTLTKGKYLPIYSCIRNQTILKLSACLSYALTTESPSTALEFTRLPRKLCTIIELRKQDFHYFLQVNSQYHFCQARFLFLHILYLPFQTGRHLFNDSFIHLTGVYHALQGKKRPVSQSKSVAFSYTWSSGLCSPLGERTLWKKILCHHKSDPAPRQDSTLT